MMELTPKSSWRRDQESPRSSLLFAAQARLHETRLQKNTTSPLAASTVAPKIPKNTFAMLPRYSSGPYRRIVLVNPFTNSTGLAKRLMAPTCSPDVFTNIQNPTAESPEFHWTIDDISRIRPAKIDSPLYQIEEVLDEETESEVQEAIQMYFSQSHNIPSPLVDGGVWVSLSRTSTPEPAMRGSTGEYANIAPELLSRAVSTPCSKSTERRILRPVDVGTQTTLSLPPELPDELQALLQPYMNTIDDSMVNNDENNTSSNTLRRKLFFHSEDEPVSPVMCNYLEEWRSKGMGGNIRQGWTPDRNTDLGKDALPSTPEISPIRLSPSEDKRIKRADGDNDDNKNNSANVSRQKLDFTRDMDVDSSLHAISYMNSSDLACDEEFARKTKRPVEEEQQEYVVRDMEEIWQPLSGMDEEEKCLVTPIFSSTIVGTATTSNTSAGVRLYESKNSEHFQESRSDTGYQTMSCCTSVSSFSCCPQSMFDKSPRKSGIKRNSNCNEHQIV